MCPEFVSVHVFLLFNAVLLLGQNKFPQTLLYLQLQQINTENTTYK